MEELNKLSGEIVDSAYIVHKTLGPGLLESVYQTCLEVEMTSRGLKVESGLTVPVMYRGLRINMGYELDLLVEGQIIIELKAVTDLIPVHRAQLLTYLKLYQKKLGLLINFNVPLIKQGIIRMIL